MEGIWKHACALRNDPTDAARHLWQHLRGRRLAGFSSVANIQLPDVSPISPASKQNLVIELDGGQHLERSVDDAARTRRMECNGYRVLRFWNDDGLLRTVDVLDEILRNLDCE